MKFSPVIIKEIKHIVIGIITGDVLILAVCTGLDMFSAELLLFVLGGSIAAMAGFIWLCNSVQKTLEKGENAKGYMTKNYLGRMILYAAWAVISVSFASSAAIKIAGALPIFFPSLTIKVMYLFKSFSKKKEEKEE